MGEDMDAKAFTKLIEERCKQNDWQGAHAVLHEMILRGVQPNEVTLNCFVLILYRRRNNAKRIEKIISRFMEEYGVKPTAKAFKVAIKVFEHDMNMEKAQEWHRKAMLHYPQDFAAHAQRTR